ncbi:MAG TPA: DUF4340 domain-containing protein [Gammaproteobacteria bacterium]|nr:DUF4340 domain-containing protein [Gammaproteobacteria bacterium]
MSPRNLLNIGMVGLVIGLGLAAWFRPGLEPPVSPTPLTTLNPAQVNHIQINRRLQPPLTFTRQANDWLLAGEPALPASPFQVHALLALLQAKVERHYSVETLDPGELGLDPPQASVILDGTTTLLIGDTEPLDSLRYIQYGTTVYLVEDRYQHLINADRTNFIERRLLDANTVITRLTLPDLTLAQAADGSWALTPDDPDVSTAAMQQLLTNWQQASALYVRSHTPGGTATQITLALAGSDTPVIFDLVARTPQLILARPDLGIEYHFSNGADARLLGLGPATPVMPSTDTPPGN